MFEKKESRSDTEVLLQEANRQTMLANLEIEKHIKETGDLIEAFARMYMGILGMFDVSLEGIRRGVGEASDPKDIFFFSGQVSFIRNFLVSYTALVEKMFAEAIGINPAFLEESLKINKKIAMLVQALKAKDDKLSESSKS